MKRFFTNYRPFQADTGLLFLRICTGIFMIISHGYPKLTKLGAGEIQFMGFAGLSPEISLYLAIGAEVFCSALVVIGLFTRPALIPLIITMLVAAFVAHADDPWSKKEFALLYLVPFVTLLFTGPGKYSADAVISRK